MDDNEYLGEHRAKLTYYEDMGREPPETDTEPEDASPPSVPAPGVTYSPATDAASPRMEGPRSPGTGPDPQGGIR